jgi:hypothetical protein
MNSNDSNDSNVNNLHIACKVLDCKLKNLSDNIKMLNRQLNHNININTVLMEFKQLESNMMREIAGHKNACQYLDIIELFEDPEYVENIIEYFKKYNMTKNHLYMIKEIITNASFEYYSMYPQLEYHDKKLSLFDAANLFCKESKNKKILEDLIYLKNIYSDE